jgi:hypothetical protein
VLPDNIIESPTPAPHSVIAASASGLELVADHQVMATGTALRPVNGNPGTTGRWFAYINARYMVLEERFETPRGLDLSEILHPGKR